MKKLVVLAVAAFFAMSTHAYADSYRAMVSQDNKAGVEQEVFFDYETGVWHGAPVSEVDRISAWKDINSETHKIALPDGRELVTLNNRPAVKMPNGDIRPL